MIYLCSCGNKKTGQPYKAAGFHKWICEKCKVKRKPKLISLTKKGTSNGKSNRR